MSKQITFGEDGRQALLKGVNKLATAVRATLGQMAAMEATAAGLVEAQIAAGHEEDNGYWIYNRRYLYALLLWMMENHSKVLDIIRELMGGGVFQMPASINLLNDPALKQTFETYWSTPKHDAIDRMKLFKLAWDTVGSGLASRAASYEKFFVGPPFTLRNYNFINTPWDDLHAEVAEAMALYDESPVQPD